MVLVFKSTDVAHQVRFKELSADLKAGKGLTHRVTSRTQVDSLDQPGRAGDVHP